MLTVTFFSSKGNFCQSEDAKEDIVCLPVLVLARLRSLFLIFFVYYKIENPANCLQTVQLQRALNRDKIFPRRYCLKRRRRLLLGRSGGMVPQESCKSRGSEMPFR